MSGTEKKRVAVIPGDGIGVEVTAEACRTLRAAAAGGGRSLELVEFDWGAEKFLREGVTLPAGAEEMLRSEFDAILLGAMGDLRVPSNQHAAEILLGLRAKLDLYANVRPVELYDRRLTPLKDRNEADVRFVVIRENTEGAYVGIGGNFKKNTKDEVAVQEDLNTWKGVERIIRFAFEYARAHGMKRVCMCDKSNALTYAHGLWQRVWAEVRKEYASMEATHLYVDALAMEMVRDPSQFDVIVTCNMFGDILSDLGAQLAGGLGLAPSGNIHPGRVSMFEPVHGSAPKIAGKNIANPLGAILAGAMMLEFLGWTAEAKKIDAAVRAAVKEGQVTQELGGKMGTRECGEWVAGEIGDRG